MRATSARTNTHRNHSEFTACVCYYRNKANRKTTILEEVCAHNPSHITKHKHQRTCWRPEALQTSTGTHNKLKIRMKFCKLERFISSAVSLTDVSSHEMFGAHEYRCVCGSWNTPAPQDTSQSFSRWRVTERQHVSLEPEEHTHLLCNDTLLSLSHTDVTVMKDQDPLKLMMKLCL